MNGFVFGTFEKSALEKDMNRPGLTSPGAFSLGHNVSSQAEVADAIEQLVPAGGRILRPADAPPHGGYRGYVADPDDHAREIAWNPAWPIDESGHVGFEIYRCHPQACGVQGPRQTDHPTAPKTALRRKPPTKGPRRS